CAVPLFVFLLLASFLLSPGCSAFTARSFASVPCCRLLLSFYFLLPALDNKLVGALVVPGLLAERRERPGRLGMIALDAPFAASVRMIHRVHGYAANRGPGAAPPCTPGLSIGFVLMVEIAHLANRCHSIHGEFANFAGRQFHQRDVAFLA